MQTASKLPPSLAAIKKRLGLRLIKFEDAGVELEPFIRYHPFETSQFLWHSIVKHYKDVNTMKLILLHLTFYHKTFHTDLPLMKIINYFYISHFYNNNYFLGIEMASSYHIRFS